MSLRFPPLPSAGRRWPLGSDPDDGSGRGSRCSPDRAAVHPPRPRGAAASFPPRDTRCAGDDVWPARLGSSVQSARCSTGRWWFRIQSDVSGALHAVVPALDPARRGGRPALASAVHLVPRSADHAGTRGDHAGDGPGSGAPGFPPGGSAATAGVHRIGRSASGDAQPCGDPGLGAAAVSAAGRRADPGGVLSRRNRQQRGGADRPCGCGPFRGDDHAQHAGGCGADPTADGTAGQSVRAGEWMDPVPQGGAGGAVTGGVGGGAEAGLPAGGPACSACDATPGGGDDRDDRGEHRGQPTGCSDRAGAAAADGLPAAAWRRFSARASDPATAG